MPEHESMTPSENGGERGREAPPGPAEEDRPTLEPEVTPSPQPRELAQRVWGSFPRVPGTAAAPSTSPAPPPPSMSEPPPPIARLAPERPPTMGEEPDDLDDLDDLDDFEGGLESAEDVQRLEDRLRSTEERLSALTQSTQQALTALGDAVHSATRDLPGAIEGVVERRLTAVGDAILKLAELRARLQEETGEAVEGIRASFHSLEERLASATQERVEASISPLRSEIASLGERLEEPAGRQAASEDGELAAVGRTLSERVGELPTRGDLAALRGALGNVASLLRTELTALSERITSIETTVRDLVGPRDVAAADASPSVPSEPDVREPAEEPPIEERSFDFGSRTEQ